jgi:hypothetical protein
VCKKQQSVDLSQSIHSHCYTVITDYGDDYYHGDDGSVIVGDDALVVATDDATVIATDDAKVIVDPPPPAGDICCEYETKCAGGTGSMGSMGMTRYLQTTTATSPPPPKGDDYYKDDDSCEYVCLKYAAAADKC